MDLRRCAFKFSSRKACSIGHITICVNLAVLIIARTAGGAASLVGNAYFLSGVRQSSLWIRACGGFMIGNDEFLQSSRIRRGHTETYNKMYRSDRNWNWKCTKNMKQPQNARCDDGDSGSLNSIRWTLSPFQIQQVPK
jgi:hypothetical protein